MKPTKHPNKNLFPLMRKLDEKYQSLSEKSAKAGPRNGEISIGGGDWMDYFFKAEAVRGTLTALRNGKSMEEAIQDGKAVGEIAIDIWNKKREWQVRRWNGWIEDYLRRLISNIGERVSSC
jgi:hypothetical protein